MKDYLHICYVAAQSTPRVGRARVAACIVYRGRLVSMGFNTYKTHPLAKKYGHNEHAIYSHAELSAIRNSLRYIGVDDLRYCSLYVGRAKIIDGKWQPGLAKPCVGCQRAIAEFGICNVHYT